MYTLSLHDALPIFFDWVSNGGLMPAAMTPAEVSRNSRRLNVVMMPLASSKGSRLGKSRPWRLARVDCGAEEGRCGAAPAERDRAVGLVAGRNKLPADDMRHMLCI